MRTLDAWWQRAARRAARAVRLEDALLGGRFASYALHRLRYLGIRTMVGTILHAARIILAYRFFRPAGFTAILILEAVASIAGGFWWGMLEALRSRVRELFHAGRPRQTTEVIEVWMRRALRLGGATAGSAVAWTAVRLTALGGGLAPVDLYIAAILLRLALDIVGRCFHSGIYAVRRVYRPLFSLLFVEFLSFGAVLGFWPLIKAWALPAAALVSALAAAGMVFHYSARAYRHVGLAPWRKTGIRKRGTRTSVPWTYGLDAGAAYAALRLEGILPLAVAAFPGRGRMPLAAFLLAVAPLVRTGAEWAQLFYFDLKKLDLPLLHRVRHHFERRVTAAAIPIGGLLGAAAFALGLAIPGRMDAVFGAALVVFFTIRSTTAAQQMRAFAAESYTLALLSGLIGAGGWVLAGRLADRPFAALALGSAALGLAAIPLLGRKKGQKSGSRPGLLALPDWLETLNELSGHVSVSAAVFSPGSMHRGWDDPTRWAEEDRWSHRQVGETIAAKLYPHGAAAAAGPGLIVWFEAGGHHETVKPEWLLIQSAGLIRSVKTTGERASGKDALRRAAETGLFGETIRAPRPGAEPTMFRLIEEFKRMGPRGVVFDPETGRGANGNPSPTSAEMQRTLSEALAFASEFFSFPRRPDSDATAYVVHGGIRLVFLADASAPAAVRARWRTRLRLAGFQAAICSD